MDTVNTAILDLLWQRTPDGGSCTSARICDSILYRHRRVRAGERERAWATRADLLSLRGRGFRSRPVGTSRLPIPRRRARPCPPPPAAPSACGEFAWARSPGRSLCVRVLAACEGGGQSQKTSPSHSLPLPPSPPPPPPPSLARSIPHRWYFTSVSGELKRKHKSNCSTAAIEAAFAPPERTGAENEEGGGSGSGGGQDCDICAVWFGGVPVEDIAPPGASSGPGGGGGASAPPADSMGILGLNSLLGLGSEVGGAAGGGGAGGAGGKAASSTLASLHGTVRFICGREELRAFLFDPHKEESGVLQKFVLPRGDKNEVLRCTWTQSLTIVERRTCKARISDVKHAAPSARALTYEMAGADASAPQTVVRSEYLVGTLQRLSEQMAGHVAAATGRRVMVSTMTTNWKLDRKERLVLLWISGVTVRPGAFGAVDGGGNALVHRPLPPAAAEAAARSPRAATAGGGGASESPRARGARRPTRPRGSAADDDPPSPDGDDAEVDATARERGFATMTTLAGASSAAAAAAQPAPAASVAAQALTAVRRAQTAGAVRPLDTSREANAPGGTAAARGGDILRPRRSALTAPAGAQILPLVGPAAHAQALRQAESERISAQLGRHTVHDPLWECPSCGGPSSAAGLQPVPVRTIAGHYAALLAALGLRPRELEGARRGSDALPSDCYWPVNPLAAAAAAGGAGVYFGYVMPQGWVRTAATVPFSLAFYIDRWVSLRAEGEAPDKSSSGTAANAPQPPQGGSAAAAAAATGAAGAAVPIPGLSSLSKSGLPSDAAAPASPKNVSPKPPAQESKGARRALFDIASFVQHESEREKAGGDGSGGGGGSGGGATVDLGELTTQFSSVFFGLSPRGRAVVRQLAPTLARAVPDFAAAAATNKGLEAMAAETAAARGAMGGGAAAVAAATAAAAAVTRGGPKLPTHIPVCSDCFCTFRAFADALLEGCAPEQALSVASTRFARVQAVTAGPHYHPPRPTSPSPAEVASGKASSSAEAAAATTAAATRTASAPATARTTTSRTTSAKPSRESRASAGSVRGASSPQGPSPPPAASASASGSAAPPPLPVAFGASADAAHTSGVGAPSPRRDDGTAAPAAFSPPPKLSLTDARHPYNKPASAASRTRSAGRPESGSQPTTTAGGPRPSAAGRTAAASSSRPASSTVPAAAGAASTGGGAKARGSAGSARGAPSSATRGKRPEMPPLVPLAPSPSSSPAAAAAAAALMIASPVTGPGVPPLSFHAGGALNPYPSVESAASHFTDATDMRYAHAGGRGGGRGGGGGGGGGDYPTSDGASGGETFGHDGGIPFNQWPASDAAPSTSSSAAAAAAAAGAASSAAGGSRASSAQRKGSAGTRAGSAGRQRTGSANNNARHTPDAAAVAAPARGGSATSTSTGSSSGGGGATPATPSGAVARRAGAGPGGRRTPAAASSSSTAAGASTGPGSARRPLSARTPRDLRSLSRKGKGAAGVHPREGGGVSGGAGGGSHHHHHHHHRDFHQQKSLADGDSYILRGAGVDGDDDDDDDVLGGGRGFGGDDNGLPSPLSSSAAAAAAAAEAAVALSASGAGRRPQTAKPDLGRESSFTGRLASGPSVTSTASIGDAQGSIEEVAAAAVGAAVVASAGRDRRRGRGSRTGGGDDDGEGGSSSPQSSPDAPSRPHSRAPSRPGSGRGSALLGAASAPVPAPAPAPAPAVGHGTHSRAPSRAASASARAAIDEIDAAMNAVMTATTGGASNPYLATGGSVSGDIGGGGGGSTSAAAAAAAAANAAAAATARSGAGTPIPTAAAASAPGPSSLPPPTDALETYKRELMQRLTALSSGASVASLPSVSGLGGAGVGGAGSAASSSLNSAGSLARLTALAGGGSTASLPRASAEGGVGGHSISGGAPPAPLPSVFQTVLENAMVSFQQSLRSISIASAVKAGSVGGAGAALAAAAAASTLSPLRVGSASALLQGGSRFSDYGSGGATVPSLYTRPSGSAGSVPSGAEVSSLTSPRAQSAGPSLNGRGMNGLRSPPGGSRHASAAGANASRPGSPLLLLSGGAGGPGSPLGSPSRPGSSSARLSRMIPGAPYMAPAGTIGGGGGGGAGGDWSRPSSSTLSRTASRPPSSHAASRPVSRGGGTGGGGGGTGPSSRPASSHDHQRGTGAGAGGGGGGGGLAMVPELHGGESITMDPLHTQPPSFPPPVARAGDNRRSMSPPQQTRDGTFASPQQQAFVGVQSPEGAGPSGLYFLGVQGGSGGPVSASKRGRGGGGVDGAAEGGSGRRGGGGGGFNLSTGPAALASMRDVIRQQEDEDEQVRQMQRALMRTSAAMARARRAREGQRGIPAGTYERLLGPAAAAMQAAKEKLAEDPEVAKLEAKIAQAKAKAAAAKAAAAGVTEGSTPRKGAGRG
jgi:hypothetical protein